ncbi:hypothetical protein ABZ471_38840 [Streptomyces sp. NPDC005728]|uniref:hypothetical protein n=1 Tax=Streptomyces sp. NPDC005728 TaxID=3157054 RepID=UPI0033D53960
MVDLSRSHRLALEAPDQLGCSVVVAVQEFCGDVAVERAVTTNPDLTHASSAEQTGQFVPAAIRAPHSTRHFQ